MIKAIAFDLDGTLYPNYRLYFRIFPLILTYLRFYSAFSVIRNQLHDEVYVQLNPAEVLIPFYERQAFMLAEYLKKDKEATKQKIDILVYKKWEKYFTRVKLFPHVKETLAAFRQAGLKLALLSDFPPKQKLAYLGLSDYFDCAISSEDTGALKPSGIPFTVLAESLGLYPEEILYVGNSYDYDIAGAKSFGMKTALIRRTIFSTGRVRDTGGADFIFRHYRQLQEYVLKKVIK